MGRKNLGWPKRAALLLTEDMDVRLRAAMLRFGCSSKTQVASKLLADKLRELFPPGDPFIESLSLGD